MISFSADYIPPVTKHTHKHTHRYRLGVHLHCNTSVTQVWAPGVTVYHVLAQSLTASTVKQNDTFGQRVLFEVKNKKTYTCTYIFRDPLTCKLCLYSRCFLSLCANSSVFGQKKKNSCTHTAVQDDRNTSGLKEGSHLTLKRETLQGSNTKQFQFKSDYHFSSTQLFWINAECSMSNRDMYSMAEIPKCTS